MRRELGVQPPVRGRRGERSRDVVVLCLLCEIHSDQEGPARMYYHCAVLVVLHTTTRKTAHSSGIGKVESTCRHRSPPRPRYFNAGAPGFTPPRMPRHTLIPTSFQYYEYYLFHVAEETKKRNLKKSASSQDALKVFQASLKEKKRRNLQNI